MLDTLRVPDTDPVSLTELDVECVPLTDTDNVSLPEPEALLLDVTEPLVLTDELPDELSYSEYDKTPLTEATKLSVGAID